MAAVLTWLEDEAAIVTLAQTQALFRQALQDPNGAMDSICNLGDELGLPVTAQEVREHLASLNDEDSNRWVVKARGGL